MSVCRRHLRSAAALWGGALLLCMLASSPARATESIAAATPEPAVGAVPAVVVETRWERLLMQRYAGPPYQKLIERVATEHGLDPQILTALVEVESNRQADAVSPKGARGLGQLMPGTARRFGVQNVHDPEENLEGAAKYLAWLVERFGGDISLALAAYNAGEGAVDAAGGIPRFRETQAYVRKVLEKAAAAGWQAVAGAGRRERVRVERAADGVLLLTNVP